MRKKAKDLLDDPVRSNMRERTRARSRAERRESEHALRSDTVSGRNDLLPEIRHVKKSPAELKLAGGKLRAFTALDIQEAANAMKAAGVIEPIMISQDGTRVINGELRVEAAKRLGLQHIPCYYVEGLSAAEERAATVSLNRLGQRRKWNMDALKIELEELDLDGVRIDTLGFDDLELDLILVDQVSASPVGDEEEELPAVTQPGDLWTMADHKLICADARDPVVHDELLGTEQVRSVITDPPYNIEVSTIVSTKHAEFAHASGEMTDEQFAEFLRRFLELAFARLIEGGTAHIFIDWRQVEIMLRVVREVGFELLNLAVWVKSNAGMGSFLRSQHELIVIAKKPGGPHKNRIQLGKRGRDRANVWFAPGAGTLGSDAREMLGKHPTPKPVTLLTDAMMDVTDADDIVLDCFGGSGSTLVAAHKARRRARLIELDPKFCDVAVRRWQRESGEQAVLAATGQTFDEVLQERHAPPPTPDPTTPPAEQAPRKRVVIHHSPADERRQSL